MDILKALSLVEAAANRPLDNPQGDLAPTGVADPSGGATGLGQDPHRPADQQQGDGAIPPQDPIQDVTPDNVIPESATLAQKFEGLMNESVGEFKVDIKKSAASLFESIELDEEFAAKAIGIFETAVNEATALHLKSVNKVAGSVMEKIVSAKVKTLEEQVDKHMNYVVAEWAQENRLAIEQGVRVQVAESLMEGLKDLLEKHYVELPTNKKDLYEAAIEKGDEILSRFNEERNKNVSLAEQNDSLKSQVEVLNRKLIIESSVQGLPATKAEKLRSLAEGFINAEDFKEKLENLKEEVNKPSKTTSNVSENKSNDVAPLNEEIRDQKEDRKVDRMVESYLKLMDRM